MQVTIGEVLALGPLRRGGARVLAGTEHLDRPVRWVHVAELPDIAHLLEGGELLLTTGLHIADDPSTQRRYVEELAEAGAAALVIELGRTFDTVPEPMVRAAGAHGLPLVSLSREIRFVEVTELVHREILGRQYALLDRAEQVSRDLTELILAGAEVGRIVGHLAGIFGTDVVFEDPAHRVVAAGGPAGAAAAGAHWDAHARSGHENGAERGAVGTSSAPPGCTWVDVWIRRARWGRLHVLGPAAGNDLLVDRAGAALALSLLSEKDAEQLAERAGSALVAELAAGRHRSGARMVARARRLGIELSVGRLGVVALEVRQGAGPALASDAERLESLHSLAGSLRSATGGLGCTAVVGLAGDRVIGVVAVPDSGPLRGALDDLVAAAVARAPRLGDLRVVAGASAEAAPGSLRRAVDEALAAVTFARHAAGGPVHHFSELGTYPLLRRLAEGPDLTRFVESELGALLDGDRGARERLLPTLRAYLEHAGRKSDAARALGIQRRTLYQRIARIETLLDRDVDDQATRTRLTLAFQGLDFLDELAAWRAGAPRT